MHIHNLASICILFIFLKLAGFYYFSNHSHLSVKILDVGQGDSILITTENGKHILVDGGSNYDADSQLFYEFPFLSACFIDVVILSHPHEDHVAGLTRILERCQVGIILENELNHTSKNYQKFLAHKKLVPSKTLYQGDSFWVDNIEFDVLWPSEDFVIAQDSKNLNMYSTVLLMTYKDFTAIFTGDAEIEALAEINTDVKDLDLFKMAHHGSSNGIYMPLLEQIQPRWCAISSGAKNRYGHPHAKALEVMESIGCKIYRTDINGTLEFIVL